MQTDKPELKDDLIWGGANIAREIGRTPRQTYHLLETGKLPAKKIGDLWVGSKTVLRRHLAGEQS